MGVEVTEETVRDSSSLSTRKSKSCSCENLAPPRISNRYAGSIYSLDDRRKRGINYGGDSFRKSFQHLEEMRRMGLHSEIIRDTARIVGGQPSQGGRSSFNWPRASAALILTGLVAQGETVVGKLVHLDRGYYRFHEKLAQLGAKIQRIEASDEDE